MKNKIFFITFMLVWVSFIILNFIVPNKSFSEQENRYLSSFPKFSFKSLVDGKYTEDLNDYINDNFIARNFFLKLNSTLNIFLGKTENNGVYIGKNGFLFEKFEYNKEKEENLLKVANVINNFLSKIDVPAYFMLIPNSIYINSKFLPDNVNAADQKEIIDNFYNNLSDKITKINVTDSLIEKNNNDNNNENLYFKTDHHITSYGAYICYLDFCKEANLDLKNVSTLKTKLVSNDFLGTFDSKAQILNQEKDKIYVYENYYNTNVKVNYDGQIKYSIFNEEYLDKKDKYSYFLNGNNAKAVIKTELKNGKNLLVIKDSYAHIFAQFFCQNFEEIHFIDPRYYKLSISDYIKENNITDVLFLYNVSNIVEDINIRTIK